MSLEVFVSHRNAPLSELGRLRLARCVVEEGWPVRRAAERFQVSPTTAARWAGRYRQLGAVGMVDRSSRPHRSPRRTPTRVERRIIKVRVTRRWGPARIGFLLGLHPSTVHRVLTRYGLARLRWLDRATGRPVRRYEHPTPGDLVHVDIKKLGRIPDGGGHRVTSRAVGQRHRAGTAGTHRDRHRKPRLGYAYLHNAVDDHSRLAYTEILGNDDKDTAAAFWTRARRLLPLTRVRRRPRRHHHTQMDPPLPAANQRQSRTVQPHPARRMGLHHHLPLRSRTRRRPPRLAAHLQSPPRPHRTRRPTTSKPRTQPVRTEQLGGPRQCDGLCLPWPCEACLAG